jgi:hypothetical protein
MTATMKLYNGGPTLFLDGKPAFDGMMWGSAPEENRYLLKEAAHHYAEAGVHIYAFDCGMGGDANAEWSGPKYGIGGDYNFSKLEKRFKQVIDIDPEARFHLRIHLETHAEWWRILHPDECEISSDGIQRNQSFASKLWREQSKDFLKALVTHIKEIGMFDRIVAYQAGAGHTGEWCKAITSMHHLCGDYSKPMKEHFHRWLQERYKGDLVKFRQAWDSPLITFETAEVPAAEEQLGTTHMSFRDPRKEQKVIDYFRCLGELCGDLVIGFCTTLKEASNGKAMVGAFYGYVMEMAWNAGFFAEGVDSEYSTIQRSGHLGIWKVLNSPVVDFLVSPYSYGFRGIGGEGSSMLPAESVRIHGKLYIFEDDSRTHLTWHDYPNFGKTDTLEDSIAVLRRNFSYVVTHSQGIWWLAGGSPIYPHVELSQQPAFRPMIKQFQQIGNWSMKLDRAPSSEIAVLLDEQSYYYESVKNDLDIPLIYQQRLWGLPKMGAPFDTYLLQDLIDGNMPEYKMYIFLNPLHLDLYQREGIKRQLRKDGKTALWIYAPGYIDDSPSLDNMADITGIHYGKGDHPWGPLMHITNFEHPITKGMRQDLFWGTNSRLGPVFHVDDPSTITLGNVVYSQGRCLPGFAVKEFPEWKSVYVAAPNIPAWVLRGIARYAGVHIYNDSGDTLYATKQLVSVHTAGGGQRSYLLPKKVDVVYDLFENKIIAEKTDHFQVTLPSASTHLYFTGDADLIKKL